MIYWLIGLGILLLPWWLLKLWRTMGAIFDTPKPVPLPKFRIDKVVPSGSFWLKGPLLFAIGALLTFLGFVCTIVFRNPQFLYLIIAGSLFLTGLFFYTYFTIFSTHEPSVHPERSPGLLQVYTHPDWLFQHPVFFVFGLANIPIGILCAFVYQDIYFALLGICGLVFLLHLWSFSQLNVLTITDRYLNLQTGLPSDGMLTIPIENIVHVQHSQGLVQRLLRTHTIRIVDHEGAELKLHTRLPHLFWSTLPIEEL
jgi:hypothetical protein